MAYTSFSPSLRLLMGAGPATLHPRITAALSRPLISHLDPGFRDLFVETRELLHYVMRTKSMMTLPIPGPGSLAMETCFANLVEPGDTIIIMNNGFYGDRMQAMAKRYGGNIVEIKQPCGEAISSDLLEDTLATYKNTKLVCFVHGESSTGVMSDIKKLARVAQHRGALTLCDIAGTLGGVPIYVDEWSLDAVYANPQKCLSAPPGLSPISISDRAMHAIRHRKTPVQSWCLDLTTLYNLSHENPCKRYYPYTSPVHCFYALHEALLMIYEEGLSRVWLRHEDNAAALTAGLKILGFEFMTSDTIRIPQVNVVRNPLNIDAKAFRDYLSHHFHLVISDGMGDWEGKTMRIGAMGQTCVFENIAFCLTSLGQTLQHFGKIVNIEAAVNASKKLAFHDASYHTSSNTFTQSSNTAINASRA
jgi:alanine-glyoxylate transaminase/serine-glyoxylate transaminase/serine-pyruvate transaminase